MSYTTHELRQGTPEWLAYRANCYNASDAGTVLGLNPYKTRGDLICEMATGITAEIDANTQRRFDDGHRFERLALPIAEAIIGEPLSPTTVSRLVPGLRRRLSASLDGSTFGDTENVEHKTLSDALASALDRGELPEQYPPQMEQGMAITGATRCLFIASKWDDNDQLIAEKHVWYESDPALRAKIIGAWMQAEADAENYTPPEVIPAAVATAQMQLPAVSVQVNGGVSIIDNLAAFGDALTAYVARINKSPETDQDFADLEATVKTLKTAEEALEAAKANALGQVASIDLLKRTADHLQELARANRLTIEKLVKAEKENRRNAILLVAQNAIVEHLAGLNTRLGKPYMPAISTDFGGAIKGLKNITSIQNAVDTELARVKIEANAIADRIDINLRFLRENALDYAFLFADASQIVLKPNDDFESLAKLRISEHKAAEAKRIEAETARIRAEEEAKAAAKVKAEQDEAARIAAIAEAERLHAATPSPVLAQTVAKPVITIDGPFTSDTPVPKEDTGAMISLGDINVMISPISINGEGLAKLGYLHIGNGRPSKMYRESDFPGICREMINHLAHVLDNHG